ncbi:addiction module antitoxin [Candidatus Thiothrix sp. Deng01]|uniref:Addiction module antitoxin n=1 Tax=Candidatus Thiothrix phosphatis TaxID=3112415 RepID=A0ABU6CTI4_9GAMM|nr:hypothetical protein [Candidatus Thiothrix sp. Deng01]MEB4590131.1 addiction module antitoxin [Candidatus Thiothrix sp. Deng01]
MGTVNDIKEAIAKLPDDVRHQLILDLNREERLCAYGYGHTPNAETLETFRKTDNGEELHHAKDVDDLFAQLEM